MGKHYDCFPMFFQLCSKKIHSLLSIIKNNLFTNTHEKLDQLCLSMNRKFSEDFCQADKKQRKKRTCSVMHTNGTGKNEPKRSEPKDCSPGWKWKFLRKSSFYFSMRKPLFQVTAVKATIQQPIQELERLPEIRNKPPLRKTLWF